MQLDPGGLIAWLVVGLIAGWLAGQFMRGGGYGLVGDIVLGILGALIGGFIFGLLLPGSSRPKMKPPTSAPRTPSTMSPTTP